MAHLSGFNPFKPTWKFNAHRVFHCLATLISCIMTAHSIGSEWPNKLEVVKVSVGIGIFTQSMVKSILIIANGDKFEKIRINIEEMYKTMEKVDNKRKAILSKCIRHCSLVFKILFSVDASAVLVFFVYPVIALVFMEERFMLFPFYCPLVDRHSALGFAVNSTIQGVLLMYTLLLHTPFDSIFAFVVLQVVAKREFLKADFDELQDFVLTTQLKLPGDQKKMKKKLRELILAHKAFDSYIDDVGNFYIGPCFTTVSTSVFSICVALILIMVVRWPLAYGLTWALSGQLFVYFVYGTIIYQQVELVNECVWNFPWFMLSTVDQKSYQLLMVKAQRPINLEIKFIGRLDMETFKDVSGIFH